ncbi:Hamartin protein-domain-containing protein [Blakeslea trispora]|nr:Hamartin protein-domain-containing protein [Blakeslea trispora]
MVSLRDIIKTITQTVRTATADSDGQAALDMIEQYIDEQTSANIGDVATVLAHVDPASVDRLSQELVQLYETICQPESAVITCQLDKQSAQHIIILSSLRALLPILKPNKIFDDWWYLLQPILTLASYSSQVKKVTRLIVSDALIMEQELMRQQHVPCVYFHRLVDMYLGWAESVHLKEEEMTAQSHQVLLDLEQDEWSKNLTTILLSVGASETKSFFLLLNKYFLSSQHRLQIVYLLSEFMRRRRTHLHEILDTPLFESMLKSLMYDNSTTLIAISVTNLIMLLPRMCTSLPRFLPQLFYIFARAICWDQLRDMRQKQQTETYTRTIEDGWDCVDYTFSKLSAPPSNPQTGAFFTSLYGLYPCNFLQFLYKPYVYFKEKEFQVPEEFDEETFKTRTIPQVTRHMLHPNLVAMNAQIELTDKTRWMKMEPPDVIAQIMSLDLTNAASRVAFAHDDRERTQTDLLDEALWDTSSQEKKREEAKAESHQEKETKPNVMSHIVTLHKALKSGAEVLVDQDIWDPSPSMTATVVESGEHPQTSEEMSQETKLLVAALKREVLLLRNELNFELFLKQQHLQHIGRLHREHVLDTSVEAERQQLYNTTRLLKAQLNQTTLALEKLKAESALTKQKHIKWEDEQSVKLRNYREQRKEWQAHMTRTEHQVNDYQQQLDEQRVQLDHARQKIFELEHQLKTLEPILNSATENEHRVKQLTQQMLLWESNMSRMEEQKRYIQGLLSQWWSMEELIASLQAENKRLNEELHLRQQHSKDHPKEQIPTQSPPPPPPPPLQVSSSDNELTRLKDTLSEFKTRLEALEMEKLEWQASKESSIHACS